MLTTMTLELDSDLLNEALILFDKMGLDLDTAVTLFLAEVVRQQALPFDVAEQC